MKQYNDFALEDLQVGQQEQFTVSITADKQALFTILSGDVNPIHLDTEYAQAKGFDDCVVYGMCTASFYSTLVGVYLPGKRCLFLEACIQWPRPVYIGDTLKITGVIKSIDTRFRIAELGSKITNQHGKIVSKAKLKIKVLE